MPSKLSIFSKIIIMICLLLVPIVFLYSYSNKVSTDVVEAEIIKSNVNRLSFFIQQADTTADQLWKAAFNLSKDPDATKLTFKSVLGNSYDVIQSKDLISSKVGIQSNTFGWINEFTIFAPSTHQVITTNSVLKYNANDLKSFGTEKWNYRKISTDQGEGYYFIHYLTEPFMSKLDSNKANLIVEVAFSVDNISHMLDQLKLGSNGDPFFYNTDYEPITGSDNQRNLTTQVIQKLQRMNLGDAGSEEFELNNRKYILTYEKSKTLDWYLIDYIPLEEMLLPITDNRKIFYLSTGLLLMLSLLAAALLYRHVQLPIKELIRGVKTMKRGDYSVRVPLKTNNEFKYLFIQFNHMSEEIQRLIENVYEEKIQVREATMKQLQSQINPHFLYNSFAFIQSLAQLENKEAIIAVTHHLSRYYRHTTRVDNQIGTLAEEIELIRNYLEIHQMQMHRLQYSIDIPSDMLSLSIAKLMLQPIVENAVIHGIAPKLGVGVIRITGAQTELELTISIEDNGVGIDREKLKRLEAKLKETMDDDMGCGLWNIQQRLIHQFGAASGLYFEISPLGGLRVKIRIIKGGN
jgi:two-component system sensor histidine kinase YesM